MHAAVLHTLGKPPRFEPFPEPVAGDGEVLVEIRAAAVNAFDRALAAGTHYASPRKLPVICGRSGVGTIDGGRRVFFGVMRSPYGSMATWAVAPRPLCFPVPDAVDDLTAAALPNPALSSWLPLTGRAQLRPGETVLVLGATGIAGKLAIQIARIFGAGRVVAAGRNKNLLSTLPSLGADAVLQLDQPDNDLAAAFAQQASIAPFDVILDYLWGRPAEVLLGSLTRREFAAVKSGIRFVQIGESAGATISLSAAALRSAATTIIGSGGIPPLEQIAQAHEQLMARAAKGELRIDVHGVPLAEIEGAWANEPAGRRMVIVV